ncbi:transport and Golgi organization protein 6 homolog [Salminus brasiliensis]|uniref:transport and Golgi organization protein 6 homolog n=1 Tax=Salminus brasiliensis TaxID=930266 RepID=UPI003B83214D
MSAALISALGLLTRPVREAHLSGAHTTQHEALLSALQNNLSELRERLLAGGELDQARQLLEEVKKEVSWFCTDTEDLTWSFVQECLLLLLCLSRHLTSLLEAFNHDPSRATPNPRTPEAAPPLPPDVLGVAQQKTLSTVLQFLVTLGLCPYLAPGVGVGLDRRSAFGAAVEAAVRREVAPSCERRLLITTTVLMEVARLSSLATLVFTRHLGDLMAALCQLGYRPHRPEGDGAENSKGLTVERKNCKQELNCLLRRVYQPIVIKELLVLQGGPKVSPGSSAGVGGRGGRTLTQAPAWLRRLCGQLLSERLIQPHGVQAVVRAILEGAGGGDSDWRKCDAVAKIVATCPQQSLSAESYYSQVCPQVLELLHFKDKVTAQQFQRVASTVALTLVQDQPEFAQRFLLSPLLSPLQHCAAVPEVTRVAGEDVSQETVPERELTRCVEDVYKIYVVGNRPSGMLLDALAKVVPTIFSLFCFTKQNVSHLRAPCQEILLWYLSHAEPSSALSLLKGLCVLQADGGGVTPGFQFSPGSEGGARLIQRELVRDEDDALYEKVSGEQWRVECLVQLLSEMKDSDLPGDLFLLLLQDLTGLAAEQQETEEEVDTSSMTLLELEQHLVGCVRGHGQRLAVLQTLAVMCEGLPHTLLLHKPTQVVAFIESMLRRACVGAEHGSENAVESQTLSMGMGLIATLLSGAAQLSAEDYSSMSSLLAPLERLSQQHPDPVIQELASDLRATIATHGAYCPGSVINAAGQYRPGASTQTLNQPKCQNTSVRTLSTHVDPSHPGQPSCIPHSTSSTAASGPSPHQQTSDHNTAVSVDEMKEQAQGSASCPQHRPGKSSRPGIGGMNTQRPAYLTPAPSPKKPFSEWLLEACDPDVPNRAMALRALTHILREGDKEALQSRDKLLSLFLENLEHEDSFVYLSAIQGLVVLADSFPEQILQRLLAEYQGELSAASPSRERSLETRLKVGEALMRASRAMGDLAPHYGRPLIGVFLSGTRDEDSSVRTSCLSNLGELCQRLQFSLSPLAQELSTCLTALIKTEKEAEVRRAAVHAIAVLLRGLSDKTTQVLGDVLLELYRALKWVVRSDSDEVAVLHAQLALEELDDVMRRFIFPQQKLEKKIVVLP